MRKYAVSLCIVILLGVISLQANQGKKKGPPWQETVASHEFRHIQGDLQPQTIYVPSEPGMYRVNVYVSGESLEYSGAYMAFLTYTDEHFSRTKLIFDEGHFGSGTHHLWSAPHQPIRIHVNAPGAVYSVYVTVEKF